MKIMKKDTALFFDIDGTLCDPNTGKIPQSAIEEINKLREDGYYCCLATGRCKNDALKNDPGNYTWDGIIAANGQEVYGKDGKSITSLSMDSKLVNKVLQIAKDNNQTLCLVTDKKWIRVGEINDNVRIAYELFHSEIDKEEPYTNQHVIYFIVFDDTEDSYKPYEALGLKAATSYYHYADIVLPGFTKAKGIQTYLKHEGIHHFYAFGDSGNDIEMLEAADKAIVMSNGDKALFPLADEIAPPVDKDGLAIILKKLHEELKKGEH